MQSLTLLSVGSVKTSWIREGCAEYTKRLHPLASFSVQELSASKERDSARQAEDECSKLLNSLQNTEGQIWALDERGTSYTSEQFSSEITACADRGEGITFVLGGAYGLNDAVRQRAHKTICLSAMTFPHELCRLIFLEQLYRSLQIKKGTGYHH